MTWLNYNTIGKLKVQVQEVKIQSYLPLFVSKF